MLTQLKHYLSLLGLIVLVLLVGVLTSSVHDSQFDQSVVEFLIRMVVVIGIYLFVGNSGITSFGHIGFMAIGAYASAWQTCCPSLKPMTMPGLPDFLLRNSVPFVPSVVMSGLLAAAVALVVGMFMMRLSGIAASTATFAFLIIVNVVYSNWREVTGGTSSIVGIPIEVDVWTAVVWVVIALIGAHAFENSRYGLSLRASRDDEVAAKAAGVNVVAQRLVAFVGSAFIVGIGGALYSHFLGVLTTDTFYLDLTFITLAMLVIGGVGSLAGATVGVLTISILIDILRRLEAGVSVGGTMVSLPSGLEEILLGVAMLLILVYRPKGLFGGRTTLT